MISARSCYGVNAVQQLITTRFILSVLVATFITGCGDSTPRSTTSAAITVAVSIAPQAWLVGRIGDPHVDVVTVLEAGRTPETYQPTDVQVGRIMSADIYFRIGVPFENSPWFSAIERAGGPVIVDTSRGVPLRYFTTADDDESPLPLDDHAVHNHHGHHHTGPDPHIWLSPPLLKIQARTIAQVLIKLDPQHKAHYVRNLESLESQLDRLDATIRDTLTPIRGKTVIVFHPAWGYLADQYSLQQAAIEIEGKQPSDYELTQLQRLARDGGIKVVFVGPQSSSRPATAIAKVIGARVEVIDPLAPDVDENLLRVARKLVESYN